MQLNTKKAQTSQLKNNNHNNKNLNQVTNVYLEWQTR